MSTGEEVGVLNNLNDPDDLDEIEKIPLKGQYSDSDEESQHFLPRPEEMCEPENPQGKASFWQSVYNLSSSIMSSSILGLSFAMANTGVYVFQILLLVFAFFSFNCIHLLLKTVDLVGTFDYEKLGDIAFGKAGKLVASYSILIRNIGAMSNYILVIKLELPIMIQAITGAKLGEWHTSGDYLVLMVLVVVILPLSLLKKKGYLGNTGGLLLFCMLFFLVVVIIKVFQIPCAPPVSDDVNETRKILNKPLIITNSTEDKDICRPQAFVFNSQTGYVLPILIFAFTCPTDILPVYAELKDHSLKRMENVTTVSFIAKFIMYFLVALSGYLTFNRHVDANLLHSYYKIDKKDVLLWIVFGAVLVDIILKAAAVLIPIRESVIGFLFPKKEFSWVRHTLITVTLLSSITLLIFVPFIEQVLGIISTCCASMMFILPTAFYIRLDRVPEKTTQKTCATIVLVIVIITTICIMGYIIYDLASPSSLK